MGYSALPVAAAGGFELNTDPLILNCGDAMAFGFTGEFALFDGVEAHAWRITNAGGAGTSASVLDTGGGMPSSADMAARVKVAIDLANLGFTVTVVSAAVTITPDEGHAVVFYTNSEGFIS